MVVQEQREREFWRGVIAEFEGLGGQVQQKDFALNRGVRLCKFRTWLYKLRRERDRDVAKEPALVTAGALVPVEIQGTGSSLAGQSLVPEAVQTGQVFQPIDVAFPDGVMVRFAAGTDPVYMSKLLCRLARGLR